jgi:hypothetical protein
MNVLFLSCPNTAVLPNNWYMKYYPIRPHNNGPAANLLGTSIRRRRGHEKVPVPLPSRWRPENKRNNFEKVGNFSAPKNDRASDHIYHAVHHNFTTKTPSQNAHFSQNHPQKHEQGRTFPRVATPGIFSEKIKRGSSKNSASQAHGNPSTRPSAHRPAGYFHWGR